MKRLAKVSLPLVVGLATLIYPQAVTGTPPAQGSGTFTDTGSTLTAPPRQADGNLILEQRGTAVLTGTFTGTVVAEIRAVVHPSGLVTFHGTEFFTGEVGGRTGTAVLRLVGTIVGTSQQGHVIVLQGTGGLENLRAEGTFEGTAGVGGTYSVQYHFDP